LIFVHVPDATGPRLGRDVALELGAGVALGSSAGVALGSCDGVADGDGAWLTGVSVVAAAVQAATRPARTIEADTTRKPAKRRRAVALGSRKSIAIPSLEGAVENWLETPGTCDS
jgi:hypothetical protein